MAEKIIGKVTHYFNRAGVAVIGLNDSLKIGDKIRIETQPPFVQKVESLQSNRVDIPSAEAGDYVGLKTDKPCKDGNIIVKLTDQARSISKEKDNTERKKTLSH